MQSDPDSGPSRVIPFLDAAIEGPGEAKLLVPQYVTPAGNPLYLPSPVGQPAALNSDSGIFGVWADIGQNGR